MSVTTSPFFDAHRDAGERFDCAVVHEDIFELKHELLPITNCRLPTASPNWQSAIGNWQ
jgi:hypothetical protein